MTLLARLVPLTLLLMLAGCGDSNTDQPPPASGTINVPASALPDRESCQVDEDPGTFVLSIASAAAHDFSECGFSPRVDDGAGLALPGGDVRCYVDTDTSPIGVYSSSARPDRAAAEEYCGAHAGIAP